MRRLVIALAVVAAFLPMPGHAAGTCSADAVHVSMKEFKFMPATITINAGQAICWTYDESATDPMPNCESPYFQLPLPVSCPGHSTTSADGLWNSGVHRADGFPFEHLFTKAGTFHYYCTVHGGSNPNNPVTHMDGDIIVTSPIVRPVPGGTAVPHVLGKKYTLPTTDSGAGDVALPGFGLIALGFAARRFAR